MRIINLLPKPKQRELKLENWFKAALKFVAVTTSSFLLVFLGQLAARAYISQRAVSLERTVQNLQQAINKGENAQLRKQITDVNSQMADFKQLWEGTPKWSRVFSAFAKDVPLGVKIINFDADVKTKKVQIQGFSPSRGLVIELYNRINLDSDNFSGINYPLENVAKPADVTFNFAFSIQEKLLK